jgi:HAE1 family hydrophobic/amphiphilic exporter-1
MNTVFTQNRVAAATAKPARGGKANGVNPPTKSMPNMIMLVTLYSEDGRYDQDFPGQLCPDQYQGHVLARIPGVGRVNVLGASDYSMRIWIQPDRLAHLGITVPEITSAIREQNVIVPGGKFGGRTRPAGAPSLPTA